MTRSEKRVIGLTGGIASGKSEVASILQALGAAIVDADAISRQLTAPGGAALPAIRAAFGDAYFDESGALERQKLAALVFKNDTELKKLNGIVHPLAIAQSRAEVERADAALVVLDAPLLIECGLEGDVDEVWVVLADEERRIARLRQRSGLSEGEARARMANQLGDEARLLHARRVFDNNGDIAALRAQVHAAYRAMMEGR